MTDRRSEMIEMSDRARENCVPAPFAKLELVALLVFALSLPAVAPAAQFQATADLKVGDSVGADDTLTFSAGADMVLPTTLGTVVSMLGYDTGAGLLKYYNGGTVFISSTTHSHIVASSGVNCTDCVELATETTGNYIATIQGIGSTITVTGSGSENATVTLGLANNSIDTTHLADTITLDAALSIVSSGQGFIVNNGSSGSGDFQVKSLGQANMLLVDTSANRVGISSAAPAATLGVGGDIRALGTITAQGGFAGAAGVGLTNVTAVDMDATCINCIDRAQISDTLGLAEIDETAMQRRADPIGCPDNQSIRIIAQDGTLTCEAVSPTSFDTVIGNEIVDATNGSLTRSGAGTGADPYKLAVSMGYSNTWTADQIFNGNIGISSATPAAKLGVTGGIIASSSITAQGGLYGNGAGLTNLNAGNLASGTLPLARGGSAANLSATGGLNQIVKQTISGNPFSVGILTTAEIPDLDTSKFNAGTLAVGRGGTAAGSFTAGQILFGNNTTNVSSSGNLFWNNAGSRLGISSGTPAAALGINGGMIASSSITAQGGFYGQGGGLTALNAGNVTTNILSLTRGGTGVALTASNGAIVYSNASTLALSPVGTAGQVLMSAGGAAPTWTNVSSLSPGTATNLAGGSAGTLPYQSAADTTAMLPAGVAGQILQTNGAAAPSWVSVSPSGTPTGTGRTVSGTGGLTGGGDLTANRTISLDLNSANTWTVNQTFNNGVTCTDCIALTSETSGNYAGSPTEAGKATKLDMPDTRAATTTPSTYSQEGVFNFKSAAAISMPSGTFAGLLGVSPWHTDDSGGGNHELAFGDGTNNLYYRYGTRAGGWGSWIALLHSGNSTSYMPSLTGTGASGTWNLSITGTAGGAPPTGAAGGALTGTYPNPTLVLDSVNGAQLADNVTLDANLNIDSNTLYVDATNNRVGIGIAPSNTLDVAGVIRGQSATLSGDVLVVGDDSKLVDIDLANTLGLYGLTDSTRGHLKLGSAGQTISGVGGFVGISSAVPAAPLGVGGNILASSNITAQQTWAFGGGGTYQVAATGDATLGRTVVGDVTVPGAGDWFLTKPAWTGAGNDTLRIRFSSGTMTALNSFASISNSGRFYARSGFTASTTPDLAEYIMADPDVRAYDLVSVSTEPAVASAPGGETVKVTKSSVPYDPRMIGVVSDGSSSFLVNAHMNDAEKTHPGQPLVLAGRFPVRVTLENGPIRRGDYLTSSSKAGYAMKATEPGPTVGIALEDFDGNGESALDESAIEGKVLCHVDIAERNMTRSVRELLAWSNHLEAENAELEAQVSELEGLKAEFIALRGKMDSFDHRRKGSGGRMRAER